MKRINLNSPKFKCLGSHLKFIHLTDLHISDFGSREKNLVCQVNEEKPDAILITGDMVVNYQNDFSACIQTLQRLKACYGLFLVFGNADHTFYPVQHFYDFVSALQAINVYILNNENVKLKINNKSLYIVGVDDPFFQFDNFDKAMRGVPFEKPIILLAHSPDILFPRTDALVINLLDSVFEKPYHKQWGWADSTYFSPEDGDVFFQNDGIHTFRIQSRQDGVFLDTILLSPYDEIDEMLKTGKFSQIDCLLRTQEMLGKYKDLVAIPASSVDINRLRGKWKKQRDPSTLFNVRLDDLPPTRKWQFQPLTKPQNYFEADFFARKQTKYHVWARMKACTGNPKNDSIFIQFSDSIDTNGQKRFRFGIPACSKHRINDVDLILTGHTHGGQIRIPFYGPFDTMTSIGKDFDAGLYRVENSTLYVSPGVGYSSFPVRLFCPPEITLFTISS